MSVVRRLRLTTWALCAAAHISAHVPAFCGRGYAPAMTKSRLDLLLAERGLFDSRSRAAAAIMAGQVRLGGAGRRADKPGQMVAEDVEVSVERGDDYVSRGGIKLANALDMLG